MLRLDSFKIWLTCSRELGIHNFMAWVPLCMAGGRQRKIRVAPNDWVFCFEGVCVTAVILAPGACGMGGPSCGSCHHFRGSRSSRGIRNEFQIAHFICVLSVKTDLDPP